jgi:hypothetical protein
LIVTATNRPGEFSRSWSFRYSHEGHARKIGLGSLRKVGLVEARRRAAKHRYALDEAQVDPQEVKQERKARRERRTFAQAFEAWWKARRPARNEKTDLATEQSIRTHVLPALGHRWCGEIAIPDIRQAIKPLLRDRRVTAPRLTQIIGRILVFAAAEGWRAAGDNPGRKDWWNALAFVELDEHEPEAMEAFPCAEIPEFIVAIRAKDGTVWRALEFLFLTGGQRSKQVREMVWGELHDLDKPDQARWIVPPERRKKGKRDLVLPLAPAVVALLGPRGADEEAVFTGQKGAKFLSINILTKALQRVANQRWKAYTLHGSSRLGFGLWAEGAGFRQTIIDRCLAHEILTKTQRAYQRQALRTIEEDKLLDESRALLNARADYCAGA